eukprot:6175910-Pleurochrysis_carterae.AAC.1
MTRVLFNNVNQYKSRYAIPIAVRCNFPHKFSVDDFVEPLWRGINKPDKRLRLSGVGEVSNATVITYLTSWKGKGQ